MTKDRLVLKFGTWKEWDFHSKEAKKLIDEYDKIGTSLGCATQHDTPRQKEILCKLIDIGDFKRVYLDWDAKWVSKEDAKKYVMEYDN